MRNSDPHALFGVQVGSGGCPIIYHAVCEEELFKRKKIEVFDSHNWARVRRMSGTNQHYVLEVTLELPPIPGSVEVHEGVLLMPEQKYEVDGRVIRFPANADNPGLEALKRQALKRH